jgi:hypothetical protein
VGQFDIGPHFQSVGGEVSHKSFMDHIFIEENNIIVRYEMGKLSPAECAGFEEHFVDCPECQKQLASEADFRQALRLEARHGGWHQGPPTPAMWLGSSGVRWAVAACLAVAVGVSLFLLVRRVQGVQTELAQTKATASEWEHKYESERQASDALKKQLQQAQGQSETNTGEKLPILASVFELNRVRSVEPDNAEPVNWVVISRQPQWIALSLDRSREDAYQSYRVTLASSSGRVLWNNTLLAATPGNALSVSLPSKLLLPGDYLLTLEGMSRAGTFDLSGRYPFRVKYKN